MRRNIWASALILTLAFTAGPFLLNEVHAAGCITSCLLNADTTIPASDGTVYVELDNSSLQVYSLPHTFSFANDSRHTLTVLNATLTSSSGARYTWNEWTHSSLQWTPTLMMQTPYMLYNYTGSMDAGAFTAKFDKQYQYSLTFKDAAGQPLTPLPSSVLLSSSGASVTTSTYSGQWLSATLWTVTTVSWEGYPMSVQTPLDLSASSGSASVTVGAYPASIKVVDKSNNPVQGATLTITLVNMTERTLTTDNQGTVQLGDIPVGPFTVRASYQGQDQGTWSEDASSGPVSTLALNIGGPASTPLVSAAVLLAIFGIALFLVIFAIKLTRKTPLPPRI